MAKFNGFESWLIVEGINKVATEMKADIRATEESGRTPLMTESYVDMVAKDAIDKVMSNTLKSK